jgi:hypothetical protein
MIEDRLGKRFPYFIAHGLTRKLSSGFFQLASELVVSFFASRESDNYNSGRQIAVGRKVVKCRNEFAIGEIAGRAEDHNAARLWHGALGQTLA